MKRASVVAGLALAYFALQVGVPGVLWLRRSSTVPSDFSWDMFATRVSCPKLIAGAVPTNGRPRRIPLETIFSKSAQLRRVLYPDRIDALARYLCPRIAEPGVEHVALRLWIECQYEPEGTLVAVTDRSRDYCTGE